MGNISSEDVIKLKQFFSGHGIPLYFLSDNMPFNSFDFKKVANEWGFELITHSPLYQKSNGLAERTVGIAKNMLKKCFETNTDIYLTLIEYRATPLTELELSPSELNFNRLNSNADQCRKFKF